MRKKKTNDWQNRIVETGQKPAKDFNFNPANFRLHSDRQRTALDALLREVGWVQGVVFNLRTNNLIDGHLRIEEALKQGDETPVPYTAVDLTPEQERLVLLLFDPIGEMAENNLESFKELADSLEIESTALIEMIADLTESLEIPEFPEFDEEVEETVEFIECPECKHRFPK